MSSSLVSVGNCRSQTFPLIVATTHVAIPVEDNVAFPNISTSA